MTQAIEVRQTEGTPIVISVKPYVPALDDYYSEYGNVECVCGANRYDPSAMCRVCKSTEIGAFQVAATEKELLESKAVVKNTVWYHSTTRADWANSIQASGLTVHLGNLFAAHERAEHEYDGGTSTEYFVYEVMLMEDAVIADTVCPDLINGWSETVEQLQENADADFVRYVNAAENIGTVSLIGNPNKFVITKKTAHHIRY